MTSTAQRADYGTSIAVTLLVLSKKKTDSKIQFIDARTKAINHGQI